MFSRLKCFLCLLLPLVWPGGWAVPLHGESQPADMSGAWLVRVEEGTDARELAQSLGATYLGPLEGVDRYHRFGFYQQLQQRPDGADPRSVIARQLEESSGILRFEEEQLLTRYPRAFRPADPLFPEQWHLENIGQSGGLPLSDAHVRPVWDAGFNGTGIAIGIVDEGTQFRHPDLISNWLNGSGYDYNDGDSDPSPSGTADRHGTAVAGISLASSNGIGGLGIAHRAKLVPLRLIAAPFRSGQEAEALSYRRQDVDIYNNSWGPSDENGVRYDDSTQVLKDALADNVVFGRGGLGNIYVWAAGNGGLNGDNSNYDGYNALPYTISVGALGHDDIKAGYSEPGANLLLVAPSGGRGKGILTTDNTGISGYATTDYYENFSGTSAAAPMVSGVVALLLESRPDLGWRDVQKILALSAAPVDFSEQKWARNGAGHWVSHDYGFGRVDAATAVILARDWPKLGPLVQVNRFASASQLPQPLAQNETVFQVINIQPEILIQHVRLRVNLNHSDWGDLRIELVSPSGTRSTLAEPHANANSSSQPGSWTYLSTHYLEEVSSGNWTLEITDERTGGSGSLLGWSLEIWGTSLAGDENASPMFEDLLVESTTYPVEVDALEGVTDPDGDSVVVIAVQRPSSGSLEDLGNGRYRFTMGQSKNGADLFSVLLSDGKGKVKRRLVRIIDPRPVGRNDLFPVNAGETAFLPVLSNDLDPDGDPLRILSIGGNFRGSVELALGNTLRYTAPADFQGVERIEYFLTDDSDGESSGWATVVVQNGESIALSFDGEDDFVRFSDAPGVGTTDRFTAEAWIYPQSYGEYVTGFGRIFDRDSFVFFLNGFDHAFYNDQSLVAYFVLDDGRGVAANSAPGSIFLNQWQHVAISYDSTAFPVPVRIYVNGNPVSVSYPLEGTTAPRRPMSDNSAVPLYIGESASGARAFSGRMAELRIWGQVRSPAAILAAHGQRLNGNEPGLSLYFPLDRTLEPVAVNAGRAGGVAEIFEAVRMPLELPWRDFENHYNLIQDFGNGWWRDRTLGKIYGDAYPWIYLSSLGWVYTGHGAGSGQYIFWSATPNWGWFQTNPGYYPWFFRYNANDWIYYLEGTENPAWFFSSTFNQWVSGNSGFPNF